MVALHPAVNFFFNDTPTTEIYTLSLHDALPILLAARLSAGRCSSRSPTVSRRSVSSEAAARLRRCAWRPWRSEEHTSELQSQSNLVCRLLLEKKKKVEKIAVDTMPRLPVQESIT